MPIDIDPLSEAELIDLNHRIIERLRLMQQLRAHVSMLEFRIGERVRFHPDGQPPVTGVITRYNKKTVSLITEAGQGWNVSPQLLERAEPGTTTTVMPTNSGNVIPLSRPDKRRSS